MGIRIERVDDALTIFTVSGAAGVDEQLAALQAFYADRPTAHVMWDFRELAGPGLSSAELRRIIDFIAAQGDRRPPGRTALVCGDQLGFGLSRMSEGLASARDLPWQLRAFLDDGEAQRWLRMPDYGC